MNAGCEVVVAGYDAPPNGRYWGNSGQKWILVRDGLSAFDPKRTNGGSDVPVSDFGDLLIIWQHLGGD